MSSRIFPSLFLFFQTTGPEESLIALCGQRGSHQLSFAVEPSQASSEKSATSRERRWFRAWGWLDGHHAVPRITWGNDGGWGAGLKGCGLGLTQLTRGFSSFDSCSRSIVAGFEMSCGKFSPCHFHYILVLYTIQWGKTFSENLPLLLSTKPKYIISAWDNCRAKWSLNFSARIISSTLRSVIHQVGLPCATQLCVVMSRSWKPCWRRKGILMTKQRHFGPRNLVVKVVVFGEMVGKLEKNRPVHLKEPGLNHDFYGGFPGLICHNFQGQYPRRKKLRLDHENLPSNKSYPLEIHLSDTGDAFCELCNLSMFTLNPTCPCVFSHPNSFPPPKKKEAHPGSRTLKMYFPLWG